jgi:hypothetical protein
VTDRQGAQRLGINVSILHRLIQAWPFSVEALALAQVGKGSKVPASKQGIERLEQGVAPRLKNARVGRLTKFDEPVHVLLGSRLFVHNPKLLPRGDFAQGQNRPQFCLNSRY